MLFIYIFIYLVLLEYLKTMIEEHQNQSTLMFTSIMNRMLTLKNLICKRNSAGAVPAADDDDDAPASYEQLDILNKIPCENVEQLKEVNDLLSSENSSTFKNMLVRF